MNKEYIFSIDELKVVIAESCYNLFRANTISEYVFSHITNAVYNFLLDKIKESD